jgi:hypothetical protein
MANDELERIQKKAFMAYSDVLSRHLSAETQDSHDDLSQDIQCADRDSNLASLKYM